MCFSDILKHAPSPLQERPFAVDDTTAETGLTKSPTDFLGKRRINAAFEFSHLCGNDLSDAKTPPDYRFLPFLFRVKSFPNDKTINVTLPSFLLYAFPIGAALVLFWNMK